MELYKYNIKYSKNGKIFSENYFTFSLVNLIKNIKLVNGKGLEILFIKES